MVKYFAKLYYASRMKNSNIHKNYYIQSVVQYDVRTEIVYSWYHSKSKSLNICSKVDRFKVINDIIAQNKNILFIENNDNIKQ